MRRAAQGLNHPRRRSGTHPVVRNPEQGLAEAKRTNRPLLMTAAAPMCRGVAGMW
ncbi:MAG: hypothetical protein GY879_07125 [Planctomycetes bacterium]|nr:hypothetical protein [Planctomycetota bacterium]MCP4862109.1 hypothetical protein [Planctomycetota bacterium]